MQLRILGPHGGELRECRSTCLLVDDALAIDAGALTSMLTLPELLRVDDILLTHSHFDHIKDIPLMSDVIVGARQKPVRIHSNEGCIKTLRSHVFNNEVWPDFTQIPSKKQPVYTLRSFKAGRTINIGAYQVRSVLVSHPVESCGYVVSDGKSVFAMSGDTGPTQLFWKKLNALPHLDLLFMECSFPNRLQGLADISGHLTPQTLASELTKLKHQNVPVIAYHLKPQYVDTITAELKAVGVQAAQLDACLSI